MKQLAIVNTRSGVRRSPERLRAVFDRVGKVAARTSFTEYGGHARELAAGAGVYDGLIMIGGDGTLNEVLNGMDLERQQLTLLPTGRGNSLARDLDLYSLTANLDALHGGRPRRIDLMNVAFDDRSGRRFQVLSASTVALAYPASVVRFRAFGTYCYAAAAACARPVRATMRLSTARPLPRWKST